MDQQDAADKERITDTSFTVFGKTQKKYHIECESSYIFAIYYPLLCLAPSYHFFAINSSSMPNRNILRFAGVFNEHA